MLKLLITSLYFILPAYVANMMPVVAGKMRFGRRADGSPRGLPGGEPISERWFGAHKTWRGFYAGFFGALFVLVAQTVLARNGVMEEYMVLDYSVGVFEILGLAFLFGFGAIFGDLVKSFLKRRVGIKSGDSWFPLDQLDFVIGAMAFVWIFVEIPGQVVALVLVATPLLHFLTNLIAYMLGLKKVWW